MTDTDHRTPLLDSVVGALDDLYHPSWADDWDAVGTVCGHPDQPVAKVLFAVDPTLAVVREAIEWGADLVVTHHPLLLKGVHGVAATTPKGRIVHELITNGIALHTCHTNADSPPGGVSESMALALGLQEIESLEPDSADPVDKLVTFVPHDDADKMIDALADAGAGAIGDYDRCTFVTLGTGSFRPLSGADPTIGTVGEVEHVPETRIETVLPRERRTAVLAAMRAAHPYEEPAFDLLELATFAGDRGSGRIGVLPEPESLAEFAARVVRALPGNDSVARIAGDPERMVHSVALCGGSGDFLLDRARTRGADVYVTSDLRHHPVSELLEHPDAPAVVDVPHWAAEWTWLPVAASRLAETMAERGATVETRVSTVVTDPWTMHVPWPGVTTGAEPRSQR